MMYLPLILLVQIKLKLSVKILIDILMKKIICYFHILKKYIEKT
jgi:hypothetical protein